ncbi:hypothetical protein IMY05_002G0212700 [Salix suchowensis]|nr:hypothetical protein IMY05_002G0212700 [Salix suchowensis]
MHCEPCLIVIRFKTCGNVSMLSGLLLRLAQLTTNTVSCWLWTCNTEMRNWSALAPINSRLSFSWRSSLVSKW